MYEDNIFLQIKAALVAVAGAFSAAFGWLGWLVLAWVICMTLDYITGSVAAASQGEWDSQKARAGIWHKAGMIGVILVSAVTDAVLALAVQNIPALGFEYYSLVLPVVLVWYIVTELGSVAENAHKMGAPVPGFLVKLLSAAKTTAEKAGEELTDHNTDN